MEICSRRRVTLADLCTDQSNGLTVAILQAARSNDVTLVMKLRVFMALREIAGGPRSLHPITFSSDFFFMLKKAGSRRQAQEGRLEKAGSRRQA